MALWFPLPVAACWMWPVVCCGQNHPKRTDTMKLQSTHAENRTHVSTYYTVHPRCIRKQGIEQPAADWVRKRDS